MDEPKRTYVTTKEVLEQVLAALDEAVRYLDEGDGFIRADLQSARDALYAELKRWEIPHYPLLGRRIAPVPVEEDK